MEDDVGEHAVGPLGGEKGAQLGRRAGPIDVRHPIAVKAESQLHWWG
jgi:hypothetical protein